jgi:hypothetical protein
MTHSVHEIHADQVVAQDCIYHLRSFLQKGKSEREVRMDSG